MAALVLLPGIAHSGHLRSAEGRRGNVIGRRPVRVSPQLRSRRCVARGQSTSGREPNFLDKLQANLPLVGLVSRIVSPEGLKGVRTGYAEYCRSVLDKKSPELVAAYESLYKEFGRRVEELESKLDEPPNVKKLEKVGLAKMDEAAILAGELMVYLIPEARGKENAMKIAQAAYYTIFGSDIDDIVLTAIQEATLKEIEGISEEEDEEDEYEVSRRMISDLEAEGALAAQNKSDSEAAEKDPSGSSSPPPTPPPASSS